MLATPPARGSNRHARFHHDRISRQLSSPQIFTSSLQLDPNTVERHNMASGFGSGSGLAQTLAASTTGTATVTGAQSDNEQSPGHKLHSNDYYFHDGNVVFLVENTLYRIHRSVLSRNSPFFRNLFAIPPPDDKPADGTSDDIPLHLPHIVIDQFDAFLSTVYPSFNPSWKPITHSTEALINILCLSTKWEFSSTRAYAIELLTSRALSPILRIELARAYDVPSWLLGSLVELARQRSPLLDTDAERLGLPTVLRLGRAREAIMRQRYLKAIEAPTEDFFETPLARHPGCWKAMSKSLGIALKNGERGGSDDDLVEEVLTAFRRLDEESLCDNCNQINLFRLRCGRWLDLDGDKSLVAKLFNL